MMFIFANHSKVFFVDFLSFHQFYLICNFLNTMIYLQSVNTESDYVVIAILKYGILLNKLLTFW